MVFNDLLPHISLLTSGTRQWKRACTRTRTRSSRFTVCRVSSPPGFDGRFTLYSVRLREASSGIIAARLISSRRFPTGFPISALS